jgi:FkbM family methyltransferase
MFKKFFRNQTKKIINKLGYNISRIDHKFENIDLDHLLSQKINIINPIVFDVGGNVGQSISKFKAIFKDPIVHSFEPNEQTYNLMYTKFREDEKIFCNNFALGDKLENKEFNVTEKTGKSSFYKLNTNDEWKKSRNKRYTTFITSRRVVKISTVDSYCKEMKINEIDLLKWILKVMRKKF